MSGTPSALPATPNSPAQQSPATQKGPSVPLNEAGDRLEDEDPIRRANLNLKRKLDERLSPDELVAGVDALCEADRLYNKNGVNAVKKAIEKAHVQCVVQFLAEGGKLEPNVLILLRRAHPEAVAFGEQERARIKRLEVERLGASISVAGAANPSSATPAAQPSTNGLPTSMVDAIKRLPEFDPMVVSSLSSWLADMMKRIVCSDNQTTLVAAHILTEKILGPKDRWSSVSEFKLDSDANIKRAVTILQPLVCANSGVSVFKALGELLVFGDKKRFTDAEKARAEFSALLKRSFGVDFATFSKASTEKDGAVLEKVWNAMQLLVAMLFHRAFPSDLGSRFTIYVDKAGEFSALPLEQIFTEFKKILAQVSTGGVDRAGEGVSTGKGEKGVNFVQNKSVEETADPAARYRLDTMGPCSCGHWHLLTKPGACGHGQPILLRDFLANGGTPPSCGICKAAHSKNGCPVQTPAAFLPTSAPAPPAPPPARKPAVGGGKFGRGRGGAKRGSSRGGGVNAISTEYSGDSRARDDHLRDSAVSGFVPLDKPVSGILPLDTHVSGLAPLDNRTSSLGLLGSGPHTSGFALLGIESDASGRRPLGKQSVSGLRSLDDVIQLLAPGAKAPLPEIEYPPIDEVREPIAWRVPVEIDGFDRIWQALLDCGACATIMAIPAVKAILVDLLQRGICRIERSDTVLYDAQDRPFEYVLKARLRLKIHGLVFEHTVLLVPDLSETVILGRDFIEKYMSMINPAAGTAVLCGKVIKIRNACAFANAPYARTSTIVNIKAGKSVDIPVRCDERVRNDKTLLPRMSGPAGLCYKSLRIAEVLAHPRSDNVYTVRCRNIGSKDVIVRDGFPLAVLEPVDLVQGEPGTPEFNVAVIRDVPFVDKAARKAEFMRARPEGVDAYSMAVRVIPARLLEPEQKQISESRIQELVADIDAHRVDSTRAPMFTQSRNGRHILIIERIKRAILVSDPIKAVEQIRGSHPASLFMTFHVGTPAECRTRPLIAADMRKILAVMRKERTGVNSVSTQSSGGPSSASAKGPEDSDAATEALIRRLAVADTRPTGPDEEVVTEQPDAAWRLSKKLSPDDRLKLLAVLNEYKDRIPISFVPGGAKVPPVDLQLKPGSRPFQARARRIPQALIADLIQNLEEGLQNGTYTKSVSSWASPLVCARKPDGSLRVCIDYTGVNAQTIPEQSAMPVPQEAWDQLKHKRLFSLIDLKSGYLQLKLTSRASEIGAFMAPPPYGLLQPLVLKEGFRNAPAIFQKAMWSFFGHLPYVFIYLDDILIASDSVEEHAEHIREVMEIFRKKNLYAHIKKSSFGKSVIKHLGHIIGNGEIRPDPKKIDAIGKAKAPKNVKELQRFMGMANFYRRFMPSQLASVTEPLNKLLRKGFQWVWNPAQQEAFEKVKSFLSSDSVLHMPDWDLPFGLKTDASGVGMGAVLFQNSVDGDGNRVECPIAFYSRALTVAERNYSTTDRELLAIVTAVEHFRYYLYGRQAVVWSDHEALKYIKSAPPEQAGRNGRWLRKLADYDLVYEYIKGSDNVVADALSRGSFVDTDEVAKITAIQSERKTARKAHIAAISAARSGLRSATRVGIRPDYRALNAGVGSEPEAPARAPGRRKRQAAGDSAESALEVPPARRRARTEGAKAAVIPSPQRPGALLGSAPSVADPNAELAHANLGDEPSADGLAGSAAPRKAADQPKVFVPEAIAQTRSEEKLKKDDPLEWVLPELDRYVRDSASKEKHYINPHGSPDNHPELLKLVAEAQKKDKRTSAIVEAVLRAPGSTPSERTSGSKRKKIRIDKFVVRNGLLYRQVLLSGRDLTTLALVVPVTARDLVHTVLYECHNTSFAGHLGAAKTLSRLRPLFWWRSMGIDVDRYCSACHACGAGKTPKTKLPGKMAVTPPPSKPWEEVGVDFIGPLVPSGKKGKKYVCVVTCLFSGEVIAWAAKNAKAEPFAHKFVKKIVCAGNTPRAIRHDRGSSFENAFVRHLFRTLGVVNLSSSGYRPQFNAAAERANGTFAQLLRTATAVQRENWHAMVPVLCAVVNSGFDTARNETPYFIAHGRDFSTPLSVAAGAHTLAPLADSHQFAMETFALLQETYKAVRGRIFDAKLAAKEQYDKKRVDVVYKPGDLVWLYTPSLDRAKPGQLNSKYRPLWAGPYRVVRRHGDVNYELSNVAAAQKLKGHPHVQRLKPYHTSDPRPRAVLRDTVADEFEFDLENEAAKTSLLAPDEPVTSPMVIVESEDPRQVPPSVEEACAVAGIKLHKIGRLGELFKGLVEIYLPMKARIASKGRELTSKQVRAAKFELVKLFKAQNSAWIGSPGRQRLWLEAVGMIRGSLSLERWLCTLILDFMTCFEAEIYAHRVYKMPKSLPPPEGNDVQAVEHE